MGSVTIFKRVNHLGILTSHRGQLSLAVPPWLDTNRTKDFTYFTMPGM